MSKGQRFDLWLQKQLRAMYEVANEPLSRNGMAERVMCALHSLRIEDAGLLLHLLKDAHITRSAAGTKCEQRERLILAPFEEIGCFPKLPICYLEYLIRKPQRRGTAGRYVAMIIDRSCPESAAREHLNPGRRHRSNGSRLRWWFPVVRWSCMQTSIVVVGLLVTACGTATVTGNSEGGVISGHGTGEQGTFMAAQTHCQKYGREARVTNLVLGGSASFECVKI